MKVRMKDRLLLTSALFAICIIALAIMGGVRNYSPVPYWDMWNGTLQFYTNINNGEYQAWWAQHNEHRIVLARLLFWLDYRYFGGLSAFLIVTNYILVGITSYVFWLFLIEAAGKKHITRREVITALLITSWLFLWAQENNFTIGFQSQFILAQLLPLTSFLWLAKSANSGRRRDFVMACTFGVLSAGAMANGVLALPLMFVYSLFIRQGTARSSTLLALSIAVNVMYFYHYHSPPNHGNLLASLMENPIGYFHFVFLYLGSPFYFLLAQGGLGKHVAVFAALFLVTSSLWLASRQLSYSRRSPAIVALLFFIIYIGGSAFGTAGGRLNFGLDMALASRYTTPSLMAFAALFVSLYASEWDSISAGVKKILVTITIAVCVLMLGAQAKALRPMNELLSGKEVAALALALDVKDDKYIESVLYPSSATALNIARVAVERHYSIFGEYPYKDLKYQIGKPFVTESATECLGNLDFIEPIDGVPSYVRVNGWIFSDIDANTPKLVQFVDKGGLIIGYALTGTPRPDVAKAISTKANLSGFRGYLRSEATGLQAIAEGSRSSCHLMVNVPPKIIDTVKLDPANLSSNHSTITKSNVIENAGWTGTDFQHSNLHKMVVLGSLVDSDANTGSLTLKMKRGDKLLYRSGPTGGRQFVEVLNVPNLVTKLPVALDWMQLDFSGELLPNTFELKISDNGDGWGEWSAIAIRN